MQRDNVFGKASRSRVEDILAIFRQRYLTEESVTRALVTLLPREFPECRSGAVAVLPLCSCRPFTSRYRYQNSCSNAGKRFGGHQRAGFPAVPRSMYLSSLSPTRWRTRETPSLRQCFVIL